MRSFFSIVKPAFSSLGALVLTGILATSGKLQAQPVLTPPEPLPPALRATLPDAAIGNPPPASTPILDPMVKQASGCCGMPPANGYSSYGCGSGQCVPGRTCTGCNSDTHIGRLLGGFYDELCCPDPCYEPRWIPAVNAAFFQDSPRPVTQTRIRWDSVANYSFPDTAEFLWARTGMGNKGPANNSPSVRYNELSIYQEIAAKGASVFVETPYRSIDPVNNPGQAGFSDMNVGVKSVLLDRDLLLISMQMKTYIPIGNFTKGLGTGHVSLEPSLMAALKLTPSTYLQTQLADWIPLGGTPGFAGQTIHYHASLNQNLCNQGDCFNVVGTVELNGYSFRGQFTDFPSGNAVGLGSLSYVNVGPGLRIQFCEKVDFGVGMAFGINNHGPAQIYRTELRIRF